MVTRNTVSRGLIGLVLVRGLGELAIAAMLPFVVLWAHQDAGLHGAGAGLLFFAQAAGEFGAGLLVGALADRFGRRRILVVSAAGMAVGYGVLAIVDSPVPAVGLFLAAGVFESAFHPVIGALVGDLVPQPGLRAAFGVVRIGTNLGRVLGPLLGAVLILLSLRVVFLAAGVLLLAAAVLAATAVPRHVERGDEDGDPEVPPGTLRALVQDARLAVLVLAAGVLAIAFTWFEVDGLVILRRQAPLSASAFAGLFVVAAATIVLTQLPISRLTASTSARAAVAAGAAIQSAGLALLLLAPHGYAVLVASVIVTSVGEAVAAPAVAELVTVRAGARRRASYQAALSISQDLGGALGPLSGLALVEAAGPVLTWTAAAALSLVSGAASAAAVGTRRPGREPRRGDAEDPIRLA